MKKITFLLCFFITYSIFSQGTEDFTNSNATASYLDGSFVGNSSITWTYVHSRNGNGDLNNSGINLPALMLRRSSNDSKITSSTISGGIANFSVKLYKGFTGGGNREVELFINGVSKGTSTPFDDFNEHIFSVSGINISGNIIIEIRNITSKQVIIDDITWTAYSNDLAVSSDQTISSDVSYDNVTVDSGQTLTIAKTGSLTISGNLTNNGIVTLNSDSNEFSSLIVQGTSSGNITYNRYVNSLSNGSGWDLIGSPVNGLQISSFVSDNTSGSSPLATGNGSGAGATGEYAIGTYDSSNNTWTNFTDSGVGSTQFIPGKGYQMATDSGATLAFTGTVDTDATETISVESFTDASGRRWNLISNPYPSYITIGPNTTTDTFLEVNDDVIDDTFVGVYGYDANTDNDGLTELFDIYNNASTGKIAPGQAFMVAARSTTAANIIFKEEMQTVSGSDDFISGDVMENAEVELRVYNDDIGIGKTKLFFDEGLSMGLDRGWDAGHYYENASITTRLTEDDQGHGMAINAMGIDAMQNAVIPLVINQAAGQEFRINLHTATIPNPNMYLEDVEEGTFTNLYEEDFVLTPTSNLSEVGRFFIHMSADTMGNEDVSTSMLNAFKEVNANYITLEGLATQSNNINVSLFNILGRKVLDTSLSNNMNTQTISTVGMASGIYVIELESGNDRLTKKLIIQ